MKTNIYLWWNPAKFFLEWKMLQTKVLEKIKTHVLSSIIFFEKRAVLWESVEKYWTAGQATDDDMAHAHCMLDT